MTSPEPVPSQLRILIIDGNPLVSNLLGMLLEKDGYEVLRAASAEEGLERARQKLPDAVILETALPGMDGYEACRRLRRTAESVIILAGPRGDSAAAVRGLQLGADDYLGRPYTYEFLASKLRACLNLRGRQSPPVSQRAAEAGIHLDANHRRVLIRGGRSVLLTRKEFDLLQFLVENHDRVIAAEDILARVWGEEYAGDRDLVKQFIYRLRVKLEEDPAQPKSIVTVRGSGYAFELAARPSFKRLVARSTSDGAPRLPTLLPGWGAGAIPPPGEVCPSTVLTGTLTDGRRRRGVKGRWMGAAPMVASALLCFLGVFLATRIAKASGGAIPGDRLYPVKIGLEGLRYGLTADEADHPALHLQCARERIEEASALLEEGRLEHLSDALAAFEREMLAASWAVAHPGLAGAEEASVPQADLEAEAWSHDEVLRALLSAAPEEARPSLEHALTVLNTGRGTSHALFIGLEPETSADPPVIGVPSEDAFLGWEGQPAEQATQGQPSAETRPQRDSPQATPVPPTVSVTGNDGPGTTGASEATGEGTQPEAPMPTPAHGRSELHRTPSPTRTPRNPRSPH